MYIPENYEIIILKCASGTFLITFLCRAVIKDICETLIEILEAMNKTKVKKGPPNV